MRLVKALDVGQRLDVAPYQDGAALARAGLTEKEGSSAAWLLLPDGARYRGAAAAWAALAVALPLVGDLALALYHLPGMRALQDRAYEWIARNRGRLAIGQPYMDDNAEG